MSVVDDVRRWLVDPHDYAWIIHHHSMRSLRTPIRAVFAGNVVVMAVCSGLLLASPEGPRGVGPVTVTLVVMAAQLAVVVAIALVPLPTTQRHAQRYFVGFAIFADVGLAMILVLYTPTVNAIGCSLFVVASALCTYFVSSRWLLAHMAWSAAVIGYALYRVADAHLFDPFAIAAGGIVLVAAVCGVPIAAHVAWNLLSIDARQSLVDPLTGLRNRRGVEASLEPLWQDAQADARAVAAVVVDIDHFKRVNDTFGHDIGDAVLRQISERMMTILGPGAVVGRTGGEEFTLVLSGSPEEVTASIESLPDRLHRPADRAPVTVSVGAAVIRSSRDHPFGPAIGRALRTADARMYEAKRAGGDRVSVAVT